MMKKGTVTAGAIVLGLGFIEYRRIMDFKEKYFVKADNFSFKLDGVHLIVNFNLKIDNKSTKTVEIKNVKGTIEHLGRTVATFNAPKNLVASAGQISSTSVGAVIDLRNYAGGLAELTKETNPDIKIKYWVTVPFKLALFVPVPITIENTTTVKIGSWVTGIKDFISKWANK